jgi:hypothetical protein
MKITKRSIKWSEWYETAYWKGGTYHCYQTKTYTEYHDRMHQQARDGGYKATTTVCRRVDFWPHLYAEEIKTTRPVHNPTGKYPACGRINIGSRR